VAKAAGATAETLKKCKEAANKDPKKETKEKKIKKCDEEANKSSKAAISDTLVKQDSA
jgi:hypothetical protein